MYSLQLGRGTPEVKAWGETHLYRGNCKVSSASGLVEPRIPALLGRGVSIVPRYISRSNPYAKYRGGGSITELQVFAA